MGRQTVWQNALGHAVIQAHVLVHGGDLRRNGAFAVIGVNVGVGDGIDLMAQDVENGQRPEFIFPGVGGLGFAGVFVLLVHQMDGPVKNPLGCGGQRNNLLSWMGG